MKIIYWGVVLTVIFFERVYSQSHHQNKFGSYNSKPVSKQKVHLPFIGKKSFETRVGISGTGTPTRFIEIYKNGDVFFSFLQPVMDADSSISERYYAGKYRSFLKCAFKKLDEVRYYNVSTKMIYEVDSNNNHLRNEACCHSYNIELGSQCPCESEFYTW